MEKHGESLRSVQAVLVWTDPTAAVASSHALVNDLDLEVYISRLIKYRTYNYYLIARTPVNLNIAMNM